MASNPEFGSEPPGYPVDVLVTLTLLLWWHSTDGNERADLLRVTIEGSVLERRISLA